MTPEDSSELVTQLSSLNERELIDVLNRVFTHFAQKFDGKGKEMNADFGDRYLLAKSSFVPEEDESPYMKVLCSPSESFLLRPHDDARESGKCPTCGVIVACTDKHALCAVCGTPDVECT